MNDIFVQMKRCALTNHLYHLTTRIRVKIFFIGSLYFYCYF